MCIILQYVHSQCQHTATRPFLCDPCTTQVNPQIPTYGCRNSQTLSFNDPCERETTKITVTSKCWECTTRAGLKFDPSSRRYCALYPDQRWISEQAVWYVPQVSFRDPGFSTIQWQRTGDEELLTTTRTADDDHDDDREPVSPTSGLFNQQYLPEDSYLYLAELFQEDDACEPAPEQNEATISENSFRGHSSDTTLQGSISEAEQPNHSTSSSSSFESPALHQILAAALQVQTPPTSPLPIHLRRQGRLRSTDARPSLVPEALRPSRNPIFERLRSISPDLRETVARMSLVPEPLVRRTPTPVLSTPSTPVDVFHDASSDESYHTASPTQDTHSHDSFYSAPTTPRLIHA